MEATNSESEPPAAPGPKFHLGPNTDAAAKLLTATRKVVRSMVMGVRD